MKTSTKIRIKEIGLPMYQIYRKIYRQYCITFAKRRMDKIYYQLFGKKINWENPQDLNEKINWLKFHADLKEWGRLADKYAVRKYVEERGESDILIPIYGKWDTFEELVADWEKLPEEFVLKSNNGCGHVKLITKENGGKSAVDLNKLRKEVTLWLSEKDYGIKYAEFQYQYIKNCIIAEKFLRDDSIKEFSIAPIDYKIQCCNGQPVLCYTAYGRTGTDTGEHNRVGDMYDLAWHQRSDLLTTRIERRVLPKPQNWEQMLEVATVLSKGHPEVRVDLYNIKGKIYFGEMTLTSASGFDTEYTQEALSLIGDKIKLDLTAKENKYYHKE